MKVFLTACFIAFLSLTAHCAVPGDVGPFSARLSLEGEQRFGSEITCSITIRNHDDRGYYLLQHRTPLEGLMAHLFTITHQGKMVPYDGLLFKRSAPSKEAYVYVAAKSSLVASLDLTEGYLLNDPGEYTVQLRTNLHFYSENPANSSSQMLSSNVAIFSLSGDDTPKPTKAGALRVNDTKILLSSPQLGAPRYIGGSSSDQKTAAVAYSAAYNLLYKSYQSAYGNPSLYKTWFGDRYYYQTVEGVYLDIKSAMEKYQFSLYFHGPNCGKDVVAYTYHGATTIYFCDGYFRAPTTGTDSKMGTIVHEMSHAVAYTEDIAYGQYDCRALAARRPSDAVNNADNYEYFAEALY